VQKKTPNLCRGILKRPLRTQSMSCNNREMSEEKKKKMHDRVAKYCEFGQMKGISMGWPCSTCMERRNTSQFLALMPLAKWPFRRSRINCSNDKVIIIIIIIIMSKSWFLLRDSLSCYWLVGSVNSRSLYSGDIHK